MMCPLATSQMVGLASVRVCERGRGVLDPRCCAKSTKEYCTDEGSSSLMQVVPGPGSWGYDAVFGGVCL